MSHNVLTFQKFDRGSERKLMMSTERPLGELAYIKIWHDNSGKDSQASGYLDYKSRYQEL